MQGRDTIVAIDERIEGLARSRESFAAYAEVVHGWKAAAHQEPWYEALQALAEGELRSNQVAAIAAMRGEEPDPERVAAEDGKPTVKLLILAPPGGGKTDTLLEFASWLMGRETLAGRTPTVGIICYSDEPAEDRSKAIRETVEYSEPYHLVFPSVIPDKKKGFGQKEWFLRGAEVGRKDPAMRAIGMDGGILSFRFDTLGIVDDPHNFREAYSQTELDRAWYTFTGSIRSRLTEWTPLVIASTRLHELDLAGRIMAADKGWHIIWTPALIADENGKERSYWPPQRLGNGKIVGKSLEYLQELRDLDAVAFTTQWMALPPSVQGAAFTRIDQVETPRLEDIAEVRQYWDTSEGISHDASAMCEFWKLKDGRLFLNNMFEGKLETLALAQRVAELHEESNESAPGQHTVWVENRLNGRSIVNFVRAHTPGLKIGLVNINAQSRGGQRLTNKLIERASAASGYCQTGQVVIPSEWRPWKDKFLQQVRSYNGKPPDDIVSAFSLGINHVFTGQRGFVRPFDVNWKGYGIGAGRR